MPCRVTEAEEEYYEKEVNTERYGLSELDRNITVRVACELAKLVEAEGLDSKLSPVAKKWIKLHKAEDAERDEAFTTNTKESPVKVDSAQAVSPPFRPKQKLLCIRVSKDRDMYGRILDAVRCEKGNRYKINGCVWSYKFGWLVAIDDELHAAADFTATYGD